MNAAALMSHDWFPRPLPANVIIGDRSWCYSSFAFLHYRSQRPCGVRIGHDSGVYHGSFFDLGPSGEVEIGDYATLVGAIICANSRVLIKDYAFIAHEVLIADACAAVPYAEGDQSDPDQSAETAIIVGENSWIGARAVLLAGARIGEGAIVGAYAVVNFPVPDFSVVAGNPARIVGSVNHDRTPSGTMVPPPEGRIPQ